MLPLRGKKRQEKVVRFPLHGKRSELPFLGDADSLPGESGYGLSLRYDLGSGYAS